MPIAIRHSLIYARSCLIGACIVLCFSPFHASWLSFILPGVLYWNIKNLNTRSQLFLHGLFFGLAEFGFGASWVYVSIHDYGFASIPLSIFLTFLFVGVLALFPALFLWTYGILSARQHPRKWKGDEYKLEFSALWVIFDWLRGWVFTGFPWLYLGYSQTSGLLTPFFAVIGAHGVTFLCVFVSCQMTQICQSRTKFIQTLILIGGMIFLPLFFLPDSWTTPKNALNIVAVQGNIPQAEKWNEQQLPAILHKYFRLSENIKPGSLIVWPEAAIPSISEHVLEYFRAWFATTQNSKNALLTGLPYYDKNDHKFYNAVLLKSLQNEQLYFKTHLVPFGEYVPLENFLRGLIRFFDLPMSNFNAGNEKQALLQWNDTILAPLICYEIAYGSLTQRRARTSNLIVTVSDDSWFGNSLGPFQHLQIAAVRALETQKPVVRVTNTGISAFIHSTGQITSVSKQNETEVLELSVVLRTGATPISIYNDGLIILVLALLIILKAIPFSGRRQMVNNRSVHKVHEDCEP